MVWGLKQELRVVMNINEALKITGFSLCTFKSQGSEIDDDCCSCSQTIPSGGNIYYERTCYEVDEGEYYCEECTIACAEHGDW